MVVVRRRASPRPFGNPRSSSLFSPDGPINEDQLAKQLEVGRTSLRESIKRLETERLVVVYPRRGIFATQVHLTDLNLLIEVRLHLEGESGVSGGAPHLARLPRKIMKSHLPKR